MGANSVFAIEHDDDLFKPVEIKEGMSITVLDCVANAFKNSPKIKRQKYNLDIAKSNVGIARAQYFPVIGAGAGFYNENNSDNIYYNNHYRELPNVGVTINKMVWDFGKTTAYIKMEEFYKLGAEYEFMDSLCSTLFDVKAKYYNLLRTKALVQVAENNVEINENFVKLAKKTPDLKTAELQLSEAKINLIQAKNNYMNSKVDLKNSMYLDNPPDFEVQNTRTFDFNNYYAYNSGLVPEAFKGYQFSFPRDKAVQMAYDNSPDLQVLISSKKAMEQSLLYIKRTYFPEHYAYINTVIIVRDDNDDITSFEDLDGKTTANTLASTYSLLAESYGAKATGVDSLADTILLVEQGRVDATLNADVSFFDYMKVHPDAPLKIVAETDTPSLVSIPVRKGEPEFLEAVNNAIEQLRESGELSEISIKYFGSDVTE